MIWRPCEPTDQGAVLELTREPMEGAVQLSWGLSALEAPPDCSNCRTQVVELDGSIRGCAMAWDWPEGQRYLSGLRIAKNIGPRPSRAFWRQAYESLMEGVDHAWTSIGTSNVRARRVLEKAVSWRPLYVPRQSVTTWFVPLPSKRSLAKPEPSPRLTPLSWRHVEIRGGHGPVYRTGRLLNRLGRPGIPQSGVSIRLADYHPDPDASAGQMRAELESFSGYDGIVVVLPEDGPQTRNWSKAAPLLSWQWQSTLYSVCWKKPETPAPIPVWKGFWL